MIFMFYTVKMDCVILSNQELKAMKIYNEACLRFGQHNWARDPELDLIDTLLEGHPQLLDMVKADILQDSKESAFGRKGTPSVEQVMRAALFLV